MVQRRLEGGQVLQHGHYSAPCLHHPLTVLTLWGEGTKIYKTKVKKKTFTLIQHMWLVVLWYIAVTFPSSLGVVMVVRKSFSLGSVANSASSLRTFVRGEDVMST